MSQNPLITQVLAIAEAAGNEILRYYKQELAVEIKDDASPVTIADHAANAIIVEQLQALNSQIPVVSEENTEAQNQQAIKHDTFWLVDPLDGTKSFIKQTSEFTVNIALIKHNKPVCGVIVVPAQGVSYFTSDDGTRAYKKESLDADALPIQIANKEESMPQIVVASASHSTPETEAFIDTLPSVEKRVSVSSSMKLCWVAEGKADIYPRFGRTMEWDIAAGHAIVNAAGGYIVDEHGKDMIYGKPPLDNPYFIAWGRKQRSIG